MIASLEKLNVRQHCNHTQPRNHNKDIKNRNSAGSSQVKKAQDLAHASHLHLAVFCFASIRAVANYLQVQRSLTAVVIIVMSQKTDEFLQLKYGQDHLATTRNKKKVS